MTVTTEKYVILGDPTSKPKIGGHSLIRSHSVIYAGTTIGSHFSTGHGVLIRENNFIGDHVSVGSHTVIERENQIGDRVRIHSNCFVPEFVIIEDDVWIGPGTTILNTFHPPCPEFERCAPSVHIKKGAIIGGNVTIGPKVIIGRQAFIGMGTVVTKNIPDLAVAYGNPAEIHGTITDLKCKTGLRENPYSNLKGRN